MTSFGIHIGNTSACLAVSKDGKTDVVASQVLLEIEQLQPLWPLQTQRLLWVWQPSRPN